MNINKAAMDLIGDLQMIPPEQAYERTKKALDEAFNAGMEHMCKIAEEIAERDREKLP